MDRRNQPPVEQLTKREMEVIRLIADAATDVQIAHKLHLTYGTVRFYIDNIKGKLGLPNRTAICRWWHMQEITRLELALSSALVATTAAGENNHE